MVKIAVVENQQSASERMKQVLTQYQKEHDRIFQIEYFEDGYDFMKKFQPVYDIIFLDIEMPQKDGMTTAREIRVIDPEVILVFVTHMAQYAVAGYEVRAMDFLLKPVNYSAFEMRMDLLLKRLPQKEEKSLLITAKDGMHKIPVSRLIYVEVNKHRVLYHTEDKILETSDSMKNVEEQLEGCSFERCDYSFLVNLRFVSWVGQKELIVGNDRLKISRPRRKAFLQALAEYIGGEA